MKLIKFIPGPLPGRNEAEKAARTNRYQAAKLKFDWTLQCQCAMGGTGKKFDRVNVELIWVEANRRRDPDNIMGGIKYVLDGIVKAGILKNDGWAQIASIENKFETGINPGVWVTLEPI
jgi:Holliday junction resolvase RusA-like endonuclease